MIYLTNIMYYTVLFLLTLTVFYCTLNWFSTVVMLLLIKVFVSTRRNLELFLPELLFKELKGSLSSLLSANLPQSGEP